MKNKVLAAAALGLIIGISAAQAAAPTAGTMSTTLTLASEELEIKGNYFIADGVCIQLGLGTLTTDADNANRTSLILGIRGYMASQDNLIPFYGIYGRYFSNERDDNRKSMIIRPNIGCEYMMSPRVGLELSAGVEYSTTSRDERDDVTGIQTFSGLASINFYF